MTVIDDHGRPEPPVAADESDTLVGFLDYQRATFEWKCQASLTRARAGIAEALAAGGLEQLAKRPWPDGRSPSLRWILCHMIEEYARHNGHADLIRESVDGKAGE